MGLAADIYRFALELSGDERFGLALQLKRAAVSIPSNIAEGSGYGPSRRNLYHVRIALGSNLELQTQLMLIERLQLAKAERVTSLLDRACEVGRMLNGLIKSIDREHTGPESGPRTPNNE